MSGIELIAVERERQVSVEGFNANWDDEHDGAALAIAAACYARLSKYQHAGCVDGEVEYRVPVDWPREWAPEWWKPSKDPIRNLTKAGALIAAEIDRLQRKAGVL